jgi:hypothetical protein
MMKLLYDGRLYLFAIEYAQSTILCQERRQFVHPPATLTMVG